MARRAHPQQQRGFTLIEIMVVVVIIGILIGLVAPQILGRVDEARVTAAHSDISTLEQALEMYRLDNGRYPTTDQGLEALIERPSSPPEPRHWSRDGYLKTRRLPVDPWGNPYLYLSSDDGYRFELYSLGADGREGGEDYNADIGIRLDDSWSR